MFPKPPGKCVNFFLETELLVFLWENLYKSTAWIQCVFSTELREPGCVRREVETATAGLFSLIVNCGEVEWHGASLGLCEFQDRDGSQSPACWSGKPHLRKVNGQPTQGVFCHMSFRQSQSSSCHMFVFMDSSVCVCVCVGGSLESGSSAHCVFVVLHSSVQNTPADCPLTPGLCVSGHYNISHKHTHTTRPFERPIVLFVCVVQSDWGCTLILGPSQTYSDIFFCLFMNTVAVLYFQLCIAYIQVTAKIKVKCLNRTLGQHDPPEHLHCVLA